MLKGSGTITSPLPINNPINRSSSASEMIVMNLAQFLVLFFVMTIWLHMLVHLTLVLFGYAFRDYFKAMCKPKMLQKT
jgi:hypothetical protein